MKRGVWVEPYDALAGFYCDACSRPTPYRWGIVVRRIGYGRDDTNDSGYFCTRHLRQLVRSAMRSLGRERPTKKRGKR